jgi:hypothetical protein
VTLSRRHAVQTLLAGLRRVRDAAAARAGRLDQPGPDPPPPGTTGTRLETAFDEALRMTVPVHLDSRGPFQFVVDTGANRTVVGVETAARCSLPATARPRCTASWDPARAAGEGAAPAGGQVQSHNLSLPVLPKASLGADGLLGIDVLKGRRMELNFRANTFEIGPRRRGRRSGAASDTRIPDPAKGIVVPAQYRSGQLVIFDADVGGIPVRAFLDSAPRSPAATRPCAPPDGGDPDYAQRMSRPS